MLKCACGAKEAWGAGYDKRRPSTGPWCHVAQLWATLPHTQGTVHAEDLKPPRSQLCHSAQPCLVCHHVVGDQQGGRLYSCQVSVRTGAHLKYACRRRAHRALLGGTDSARRRAWSTAARQAAARPAQRAKASLGQNCLGKHRRARAGACSVLKPCESRTWCEATMAVVQAVSMRAWSPGTRCARREGNGPQGGRRAGSTAKVSGSSTPLAAERPQGWAC